MVTKIKELEAAIRVLSKETNCKGVDKILDQQSMPEIEGNGSQSKKDTMQNIDDFIQGMGI